MTAIDHSGERFGRLLVVKRSEKSRPSQIKWVCVCDCGAIATVLGGNLRQGRQKSCGCLNAELRAARVEASRKSQDHKREKDKARKIRYNSTAKGKAAQKRYFQSNKEACLQRASTWAKANPESGRSAVRNRRALLRGAEGSHSRQDIFRIGREQDWKCAGCSIAIDGSFQADHVEPLSRGGSNSVENIQLLCQPCNARKSAKPLLVFMAELFPDLFSVSMPKADFYQA